MPKLPKVKIATTVIASTVLLSGCGLFGGEQAMKEIDPPQDVNMVDDQAKLEDGKSSEGNDKKEEATKDTVTRELYLVDKNGYVVPQTFELPKENSAAQQVLEYLVEGGPVTNMLPEGFKAVLPPDTQMTTDLLKDGTLVVDFSNEFTEYKAEDEQKILQSLTWTLTQFDTIKKVNIKVNGHEQNVMPVNKTPINDSLTRADGINVDNSDVVDVMNSELITLYFLAQEGENTYYVPVTKRVQETSEDKIVATINELIKGPGLVGGLLSEFNSEVELISEPDYKNGVVTLNFNESILGNLEGTAISKHIINSLVLSLTEQPGVESVAIQVNGKADLKADSGEELTKPVTRPQTVNTGEF
ncbi:GerMN domain-containing protein [Bacillus suaedaesalsae]|uniref:GerMN domain-containing protein n=1 Tax=Bacillus suaedaesalsae TaxID=2810349 RepID=A0ABS2DMS7_9BACI|nr:GerMN domain-containing protein [Bacillus suaedaesalsae]MBM6619787.1 GerMN domain-containing protein [Bacillus suaedaesalsae]